MKLVKAIFHNYADILAGTGKSKLELDFSKSKNRVTLILGPNGSGKTAIMSKIHPFAFTIGDKRSGKSIIVDGKPGYKEMHYLEKGNLYVIKHFINEKGTVKSYISLNGEELNPNGNVTSFKEIVEASLYITEDKMKLMRLGSNSSTFIQMSSTERKSFTMELLSDIDIYGSLYRKLNEDYRVLRGLIRNISTKIEGLNLGDIATVQSNIQRFDDQIESLQSERDSLLLKLGNAKGRMAELTPEYMYELSEELSVITDKQKKLQRKVQNSEGKDLVSAQTEFNETKQALKELEHLLIQKESSLTSLRDKENDLLNKIEEVDSKLMVVQSREEIGTLQTMLLDTDKKIKELEEQFKNFNTKATAEDFKRLIDIYREVDARALVMHSFDHNMIREIVEMEMSGENVETYLNRMLKQKTNEVEQAKASIMATKHRKNTDGHRYLIIRDSKCNCDCPFETFFNEVTNQSTKDIDDFERELRIAEHDLDLMNDRFAIASNIRFIKMILDANLVVISRLPAGMISLNAILSNIMLSLPIYDEERITKFITFMEEYERVDMLKERRIELREEISRIRGNQDTINFLTEESVKYKIALDSVRDKIHSIIDQITKLREKVKNKQTSVDELEELVESLREHHQIMVEQTNLLKRIEEIHTIRNERTRVLDMIEVQETAIRGVDTNIAFHTKNREELIRRMDALNTYQRELDVLNKKYERIDLVRDAVSSRKGIPLKYIRLYMMDINVHINNILKQIYGDSLEIEEMIIDEKEFRIPYRKNGVYVPDVSMVSQGEESFLALAFSTAFKRREAGGYNVYTLDELDGPLDYTKRDRFNRTLEQEMNEVNAEQALIISHNSSFENYPVDIILLSKDFDISAYKNANVIYMN